MPAQAQFIEFGTEIMTPSEHSRLCRFADTHLQRSGCTDRHRHFRDMVSIHTPHPAASMCYTYLSSGKLSALLPSSRTCTRIRLV